MSSNSDINKNIVPTTPYDVPQSSPYPNETNQEVIPFADSRPIEEAEEEEHDPNAPDAKALKQRRKRRQVGVAIPSAIVGGVLLGPAGAIVGGVAGALITKKVQKKRDKKTIQKYEESVASARAATASNPGILA